MNAPTEVGVSTAHVSGTVNPEGGGPFGAVVWTFEFSSDGGATWTESLSGVIEGPEVQGSTPIAVAGTLTGVKPGTGYQLRLHATNFEEESVSPAPDPTFTTQAATAPTLVLNGASEVSYLQAHLSGTIDPNGGNSNPVGGTVPLEWRLEFSHEPGGEEGWRVAASGQIEGAEAESSAPITVEGEAGAGEQERLRPSTTYETRLLVTYANTEAVSAEPFPSFETLAVVKPTISELQIGAVTATTADLSARIDPGSPKPAAETSAAEKEAFATTWSFTCTPECPGLGGSVEADDTGRLVPAEATALLPGTGYVVTVSATNAGGRSEAGPVSFTTPPVAPTILSTFAADVTGETAVLKAEIDPGGAATTAHFQYVDQASFEAEGGFSSPKTKTTPESASIGGDDLEHLASATIEGLAPETAYDFRVVASNSARQGVAGPTKVLNTVEAGAVGACPNEQLRRESDIDPATGVPYSAELPDCRAFELVSPVFKNLSFAGSVRFSADGSRVFAFAVGGFAGTGGNNSANGNDYQFSRTGSGWKTVALIPPASELLRTTTLEPGKAAADDGEAIMSFRRPGGPALEDDLYRRAPDGALAEIGPFTPPDQLPSVVDDGANAGKYWHFAGASSDLTHVLFDTEALDQSIFPLGLVDTRWPGETTLYAGECSGSCFAGRSLYEYSGSGNTEPELVGVSNQGPLTGTPHRNEGAEEISRCSTVLGGAPSETHFSESNTHNAVSADGEAVFFTAMACAGEPPVNELFARLGGAETIAISEPLALSSTEPDGACTTVECLRNITEVADFRGAAFQGASADGSKVVFTSPQQLTDEATEDPDREATAAVGQNCQGDCNLYLYDFARPAGHRLLDLSAGALGGGGPQVQGVGAISEDGSHVYFVAQGVLTEAANEFGATAQPGQDNLYVYDVADERSTFIATLAAGDQVQWRNSVESPMQTTASGRFLLFASVADPTPDARGPESQLYRYDSADRRLVRVSIGEEGFAEDGNAAGAVEAPTPHWRIPSVNKSSSPALSTDGTVVFEARGAFTPGAPEPAQNFYEYRGGHVHLIASAPIISFEGPFGPEARQSGGLEGIDASGRDIFIEIAEPLVPGDTDTSRDIYDARAEGGFPAPLADSTCEAEACQPSQAFPPASPAPATPGFRGAGNEKPKPTCHKGKVRQGGASKQSKSDPSAQGAKTQPSSGSGKCVAKKHKAKKHKKKGHKRHVKANRGAGK